MYPPFPSSNLNNDEIKNITIISKKRKVVLNISTILYVLMVGNNAEIHISGDKVYETRMTLGGLEKLPLKKLIGSYFRSLFNIFQSL